MPSRAPRRCTTPGCPRTPTPPSSKCDRCATPRPRPSATTQGYDREHRDRFRAGVLQRDPVCVLCHQAPSEHADHHPRSKRELRELGWDDNNPAYGRGLCARCHSKETARHQPAGWNAGLPPY